MAQDGLPYSLALRTAPVRSRVTAVNHIAILSHFCIFFFFLLSFIKGSLNIARKRLGWLPGAAEGQQQKASLGVSSFAVVPLLYLGASLASFLHIYSPAAARGWRQHQFG